MFIARAKEDEATASGGRLVFEGSGRRCRGVSPAQPERGRNTQKDFCLKMHVINWSEVVIFVRDKNMT